MTPRKRRQREITAEEARRRLQEAGLRRTASRVAVLQELAASAAPLTHAELASRLEGAGFGAPTVFRCLGDLAEAGLAVRLDLGDHVWRFGLHGGHDDEAVRHPHFVCLECGQATCLTSINVRISAKRRQKGRDFGDVSEVVLKGRCPTCR
jgi:Fur family ferric uptake transcriptional regulator